MYVIYTALEDFLNEVAARHGGEVRLEATRRESYTHGIPDSEIHRLTLTAAFGGLIHAVRVDVARLSRLHADATIMVARARLTEITMQLVATLTDCLAQRRVRVAPGLLLAPGLRDDLEHVVAGQRLWSIRQEVRDNPASLVLTLTADWNPFAAPDTHGV